MGEGSRKHRDTGINYTLKYSRRKTIAISISPSGTITVRAPHFTSDRIIDDVIGRKSEWINKNLKNFSSMVFLDSVSGLSDGDTILFRGTEHRLRICRSDKTYIRYENGTIEAGIEERHGSTVVRAMLELFYKNSAARILRPMFNELLEKHRKYGFRPTSFSVKKMKSRWGSCSSSGKIALSYDLIRLDRRFAEYVIIHELCHLRHLNHGRDFYALLSEIHPGWEAVRAELRRYVRKSNP
jgi:predicted metal-dependent hydrolase